MRFVTACFLAAASLLHAEHGETSSLMQSFRKLAGERSASVSDEWLRVSWVKKDGVWWCAFADSKGKAEISSADGSRAERGDEKGERSKRLRTNQGSQRRNDRKSPDGKQEVTFEKRKVVKLGDWKVVVPKSWSWSRGVFWSENSRWFQVTRVREVKERQVHYTRSSPKDSLQPEHFTANYPKPGDELRTRVPVIFSADGGMIEVDEKLVENPYSISNVRWVDEKRLWFEFIERGFGKYRLIELNAETGKSRVVAEETDDKFLHVFEKCDWWPLADGKLLWRSEQDGWSHLYLVDEKSGERKQLTKGEWPVRGVSRVKGDEVIFSLSGYHQDQDPYHKHWATLNWRTGKMTLLTEGDGTHELQWSPDLSYYVDRWSRADHLPVHELRRKSDGGLVAELSRASGADVVMPERFVTKDREGRYDIHGLIWKPVDFDPAKKYPVIENIYAGPHGAFVPKEWKIWHGHISEMTASGFVVVKLDGRGTNYRGKEFQQFAYKNLKDSGFPDRKKWITEAAKNRPWMDLSRVGIYGGSAGGQSALAGLLWHGDFYKAGAADCGCHDNRMDKIWWNEQWMDWPVDESYAANSNTEHIGLLKGDLFLTVGEVDTNVDPSSTMQVVDELIKADKDFEFYSVPNGKHGIGESAYLKRKRIEFFQRSLGGATFSH